MYKRQVQDKEQNGSDTSTDSSQTQQNEYPSFSYLWIALIILGLAVIIWIIIQVVRAKQKKASNAIETDAKDVELPQSSTIQNSLDGNSSTPMENQASDSIQEEATKDDEN